VFDELRLFLQEMGVIPMSKEYGPGKMYHYEPTTLPPHEQSPIVDFKQEFEYKWMHIVTGTWGTRKVRLDTRLDFLEQLNRWNQMGNGTWIYTEK
jgi:hypothetical protein